MLELEAVVLYFLCFGECLLKIADILYVDK
jgi:hypothetical protein